MRTNKNKKYKYIALPLANPIKYKETTKSKENNYLGDEFILLLAIIYDESHRSSVGVVVQTNRGIEEYFGDDAICFHTHYKPVDKL